MLHTTSPSTSSWITACNFQVKSLPRFAPYLALTISPWIHITLIKTTKLSATKRFFHVPDTTFSDIKKPETLLFNRLHTHIIPRSIKLLIKQRAPSWHAGTLLCQRSYALTTSYRWTSMANHLRNYCAPDSKFAFVLCATRSKLTQGTRINVIYTITTDAYAKHRHSNRTT